MFRFFSLRKSSMWKFINFDYSYLRDIPTLQLAVTQVLRCVSHRHQYQYGYKSPAQFSPSNNATLEVMLSGESIGAEPMLHLDIP